MVLRHGKSSAAVIAWSVIRAVCCFLGAALFFVSSDAFADEPNTPLQPKYGWREVWAGADATKDVWLLYSGVTLAPWSNDIYSDGWRLRAAGGYGQYQHQTFVSRPCGAPKYDACAFQNQTVNHSYSDILLGYQARFGPLTAKAFVGPSLTTHSFDRTAAFGRVAGTEVGAKAIVELWLNIGEKGWTSVDLSYATAQDTSDFRWRAGWRAIPNLSLGPEVRFDNVSYDELFERMETRVGLFARYDWIGGEVSLAGGLAGTVTDVSDTPELVPYGTLNVLLQF